MKKMVQEIYINLDDSGKLTTNEQICVYGGLVFLSKKEKDKFITQYRSIINEIKCSYCKECDNNCPEIKNTNIKRKDKRLNETITDLLAIETTNILHNKGIYFLDDKLTTLSQIDNFNTRRIVKEAVSEFYTRYRKHILEARIYGNITYLTNKIGEDNFEEFNNIIDNIDFLSEQGLESKIEENKMDDDLVIEYNLLLQRLQEVYKNMEDIYNNYNDPYNPFSFIKKKKR